MDQASTKSIRAIASTMVRQFLTPFIIVGAALLIVALIIVIILSVNYSGWWLVFLIPLLLVGLLFTVIVSSLWFIYKKITPVMTKNQAQAVRRFTDRVAGYSDIVGTPRFIIAYRIVRDVSRQRPRKYLGELLDSSQELKRDFRAVRDSFKS